ncbi:SDR family NAD(P)-dependent oxidoreductase [Paenibacillus pini]|uniref:Malonyl CoA-acyl carrier protein transacylase n=1 Tax=Paenibacillus pini JCM 16418 TaxID=1236976 RepID=W7YFR5_9BACL|nr:SDR family NAD(P)-dependent oxidoreductase [Paenibacillus pini]GAF06363.1 malonyl CoA-acyl carrier protein transacylase [Paenibacillus pini JCM 16418]
MVKAALALKQGIIPPTLHFNGPNKKIRFTDSPVYVNTTPRKWNLGHSPHRCGVSSFGFSGTNCHLILEEAPIRITTGEVPEVRTEPYLLTLSAGSESGLHRLIHEYEDYLQGNPSLTLEELCYTANTGRGHYRFRLALLVHELSELKSLLSTLGRNGIQGDDIHVFCKNEDGLIPYGAEANLTEQAEKLVEELTFLSHSKHAEWSRLCQLYVNGASIDFDQLYKRHSIHRVPLPTYPFERDVHWLNDPAIRQRTRLQTAFPMESKTGDNKDEAAGGQGSEPLSNQLYYKINWETMPKTKRDSSQLMGKVLVLSNGNPMAELIIERLRNKGESVVIARFGHHFEQTGADSCIVNGSEDDFDQLLHWIGAGEISRVIHMASPSNLIGERSNLSWEQFEQSQAQGTYSLLFLVRSLIHAGCQQRIDISLIADHVHHVNGDEPGLNPEAGALFGLGKVVHTEYDNLRCRAIDMDAATGPDDILEELYLEREYYNVAFRSGNKYMERFSKAELSDYAEMPVKVKDEGAYIITGGTGALGLEAAKYLVERGAAHIALVSRAPLPVREDWNSLLEGEDHNLTAKLRGVMELEAKGAVVSCYSANVSDIHAMNVVMQDIRSQYGLIYGIVHSAGVAGDGFLINKSLDVFNEVYLPKVYGTWILDHLTQGDPLDFFILYSSGASLIGEAGQGDYCAANSYLDAFAAYRSARGQRTQTINWVKWRDIGLAVNKGSNHDGLYKLLATEIAMKALDEILHRDITQIMVGQMNLESQYLSMMELFPFKLAPEIEAVVKRSVSEQSRILESNGSEKNISVTIQMSGREGSSYSEVEMTLATVYQEVLGFKEINVFDNFFELGGNSIMLNLMYARLQKLYPGQLKLTDLFTYTSISRLAEYLTNNNNSSNRVLSKSNEDEKPDISKLLDEMQSGKWSIDQMMEFMK